MLRHARVAHAPQPVGPAHDLGVALVGAERVAAGGDEIDHRLEILVREPAVGRGGAHLLVERADVEGLGAGHAEHVLGEHVEGAEARVGRVLRRLVHGVERRPAFEDLEAVGRHEIGLGRLVEAVVGAADALHDAARAFRGAVIDDEIDVAPVDAEIEGRGADHGAQPALGHGRLDAPPLPDVERAVMEGDGETVLVEVPELLEDELGLEARVDEDERRPVRADQVVDLRHEARARVAGERQRRVERDHADVGLRAAPHHDEIGERTLPWRGRVGAKLRGGVTP